MLIYYAEQTCITIQLGSRVALLLGPHGIIRINLASGVRVGQSAI